ncbi:hypothetical protein [Leptospira santarosai]|uniref:hypothetical protein n=1 Tax=Leptospira santarosai TaxID=28183 RepID=UPI00158D040C
MSRSRRVTRQSVVSIRDGILSYLALKQTYIFYFRIPNETIDRSFTLSHFIEIVDKHVLEHREHLSKGYEAFAVMKSYLKNSTSYLKPAFGKFHRILKQLRSTPKK